jgi:proteic killer suppression protein
LEKECSSRKLLQKRHGQRRADRIQQRLEDLASADSLEDMRTLPGRCHELHGEDAGHLSLDLDHPYRLVFCPAADQLVKVDGGINWAEVKTVEILGVKDTHE